MNSGIPYFPLDVHLDDKFELLEAEFGLTAFAVIVKLFQKIYGGQGYYCEWTKDVALLFARKIGLGGNAVSEIISASIKRGIFDKDIFDKYHVLTSAGIQRRYFEAVSRRKNVSVKTEYLLIPHTPKSKNANNLSENVNIQEENADIFEQSKVEKSKEENSKVNESNTRPPERPHTRAAKKAYGNYKNVMLTDDELERLKTEHGNYGELIEFLDEYIEMKGYKVVSCYAAINKWVVDAVAERAQKRRTQPGYRREEVFRDNTDHEALEKIIWDKLGQ